MVNPSVYFFLNKITTRDDIEPLKYVPCDSTVPVSVCCVIGESCTGSRLCYSALGSIYRGACTDRNWGDSCPQICTDDGAGFNKLACALFKAGSEGKSTPSAKITI
ncbi:uncharacterized protein K441DRAFT_296276 [Cenococcum geophilum 1.58]|uniref:uncharacterized protein n=1 Tax=Cenococcum geophilum 1.58 TaxID=794803 RepID=UPI00358EFBD2|nr:hypothetical protein K441DRAFT_296276 [Cenococcum geophilum 1.58]